LKIKIRIKREEGPTRNQTWGILKYISVKISFEKSETIQDQRANVSGVLGQKLGYDTFWPFTNLKHGKPSLFLKKYALAWGGMSYFQVNELRDKPIFANLSTLLEQNVFKYYPLSFDDNKVLKIVNWIC